MTLENVRQLVWLSTNLALKCRCLKKQFKVSMLISNKITLGLKLRHVKLSIKQVRENQKMRTLISRFQTDHSSDIESTVELESDLDLDLEL